MLRTIFVTAFAAASFSASAATYNIAIGQSADLQQGDVVLVRDGAALSAVTCGGAPAPARPARQDFNISREVRFDDIFQTGADINRSVQCGQYSGEQSINQARADALYAARETCFAAGYNNCAQPMTTDQQYSFQVRGFAGNYTCLVVARIIGTQPQP